MKNRSLLPYRIATVLIFLLFIILFLTQSFLIILVKKLPPCPIYTRVHLYCPACGNTRSVIALLHGDLLTAIKYNITPIVFGIFILLAYLELIFYSLGRQVRLLPRKLRYYLIIISLLIIYVGVRNFIPNMTPGI